MNDSLRKKSPRAPSVPLDEALERALKAYDKERLHPAPTDVVAQNLGYKSANNGSALSVLASLRYFGLLERPKEGFLAVSKAVEDYKFSPDESHRRSILVGFLTSPPLYAELLEKFSSGLPSDANLRFELIQRGFIPQAAESTLNMFRRSVEFVDYFSDKEASSAAADDGDTQPESATPIASQPTQVQSSRSSEIPVPEVVDSGMDRIPVRLPGGRRAWLIIPEPLFESDKERLKAQIDLLLTEDEE